MLSIDVGSKKVCVIEGNYHGSIVTVSSFGEIMYENEVVSGGVITDQSTLGFLINKIIIDKHMKSKSAVITIQSNDIIIRELILPNVKFSTLKLLINNEIYKIIRDDTGFVIDFIVMGVTNDKMLKVMAYAVPKAIVESYYTLLKELKLSPYALDVPENSISKLLSSTSINGETHESSNIIATDIGFTNISFHGFSRGVSSFNRTDISPVQEFVREIGSVNRMDVTNKYIAELNFSPNYKYENHAVTETCKYLIYNLSEEIRKYMQYIIMNSEIKSIEKIYIYGGISSAIGLDIALSDILNMPVEQLKSVGRVSIPDEFSLTKTCNAAGALIRLGG